MEGEECAEGPPSPSWGEEREEEEEEQGEGEETAEVSGAGGVARCPAPNRSLGACRQPP